MHWLLDRGLKSLRATTEMTLIDKNGPIIAAAQANSTAFCEVIPDKCSIYAMWKNCC